ncbi:PMR1-type calcium-transporting P-type ATPase [Entophlyctis helioformis]|nr:PMR1-type calcium-transporting P-type ATPase [Entophlyctis helioformis]
MLSTSSPSHAAHSHAAHRHDAHGSHSAPSLSDRFARCSAWEACDRTKTNMESGLDHADIVKRRLLHGANELELDEPESLLAKFAEQFQNPLILLLLGSAVVSVLLGNVQDAVSITLAIVIVLTVAFVQEYQSEKSLEALNKLAPPHCHVKRNGHVTEILASDLVPGDVVVFSRGDRVPADVRLLEAVQLDVDESSLTGENEPMRKQTDEVHATGAHLALTERRNVAFMGTLVRHGHGTGVVFATGKDTELGHVFKMMKDVETRKTPLQAKMDILGKQLSGASFAVIAVITLVGILQGRNWLEMFTVGVSLAVAAIPEGLPIVVTVTLALGVLRMASHNAIVKKLPSVESLGAVSVVCVDKTGTLTMNKMAITKLYTPAHHQIVDVEHRADSYLLRDAPLAALVRTANLCNNASRDQEGKMVGQPSEVAILELVTRFSLPDARQSEQRLSEIPFNADRKSMSVEYRPAGSSVSVFHVKGALEAIIGSCSRYYISDTETGVLDESRRWELKSYEQKFAATGLRVLAFAYGSTSSSTDLVFLGLAAMYDPPRPGISDTIRTLVEAGIRVVMLTGDSDGTATAIATQLGIPMNVSDVMSGSEIERTSATELAQRIHSVSVFYRMTPAHKLAIIRAYQAAGDIVAMTGDGVNDAPALRLADIGVSMGKHGTDVAKEAADMILVNDNFNTIVYAIEEGKTIFYNIQNFLCFQLSTSVSALAIIAVATFLGFDNPLNAMQILWINIICDGPVAQSLGVEAVNPEVMKQPPRHKDEPIVTRSLVMRILTMAAVIVVGTMGVYIHELDDGLVSARGRTMTFTCFVFFDMWNSLSCRSATRLTSQIGLLTNRFYVTAVAACVGGQLLVIYVPFLQSVFQTTALSLVDLAALAALTSSVFWIDEVRKLIAGASTIGRGGSGGSGGYAPVGRNAEP